MNDLNRGRLAANWQAVNDDVGAASLACGRRAESVKIIGVSKYVDADCTKALFDLGCTNLGESRPQSLWQKAESLGLVGRVQWHMIGHLQTNKVRRLLKQHPIIHSIDSQRLLDCVAQESSALELTTKVLLEVNISGDSAKTGLTPEAAAAVLQSRPQRGVKVVGLMAMAGWDTSTAEARRHFDSTRQLRDQLQQQFGIELAELSMGMSGDYHEAIAAGATMVRIGSRLFEGLIDEE